MSASDADKLFHELDPDHNGVIVLRELKCVLAEAQRMREAAPPVPPALQSTSLSLRAPRAREYHTSASAAALLPPVSHEYHHRMAKHRNHNGDIFPGASPPRHDGRTVDLTFSLYEQKPLPDIQQERALQRAPWVDQFAAVPAAGRSSGQYMYVGRVAARVRGDRSRPTSVLAMGGNPRQHPEAAGYKIPGYLGFVPGLASENCHGASYASLVTEATEAVHGRVQKHRASGSKQRVGRASTSCPELVRPLRGPPHSGAALTLKGPRPWL